ncbi:hypothetical protein BDBG_18088, partial [Blastomyces gilchristii SLH14081]
SSHIDRSVSADDSKHLNVKLLIENLKNIIMKKLSVLYITESSMSLSALSITVSFSVTSSQSSTLISVSCSPAFVISIPAILTSATSVFSVSAASAVIISSSYFKKMLCRLDKLHFSRITLLFNSIKKIMKNIHVFRNENMNIILFYTYKCEA